MLCHPVITKAAAAATAQKPLATLLEHLHMEQLLAEDTAPYHHCLHMYESAFVLTCTNIAGYTVTTELIDWMPQTHVFQALYANTLAIPFLA